MVTQLQNPIIHVFKEINEGKFRSVKHYELVDVINDNSLLSNQLNISKNRNCALSMPDFWLKIRQGKKWSNYITGLFKTGKSSIYKGDVNKKQHLLIFKFSDEVTLIVYYFKDYYTKDLTNVLPLID